MYPVYVRRVSVGFQTGHRSDTICGIPAASGRIAVSAVIQPFSDSPLPAERFYNRPAGGIRIDWLGKMNVETT